MDTPSGVRDIRDAIVAGRVSAVEHCRHTLDQIASLDPPLNAFRGVAPGRALARAAELDAQRDRRRWPLFGVPVAIKDNICTRGLATTASSRILDGYIPPYDATVVERLEAAGAIIVGKTNCDEFAMGSSTENSAFGPTRNPWALDRIPGGSSGGSAAAVAARMVPMALGSDTGGSIRQPAALCGVVGFKPSYGRVSRYGLLAFASSLDQIGPITTTVADAALVMNVLAGSDPRDSTASAAPVPDFAHALDEPRDGLRGVRIGVPRHLFSDGVDEDVLSAFEAALAVTRDRGAELVDVALPYSPQAIPVYYIVATAEASSNLARYDGVRYGHRAGPAHTPVEMYERSRGGGFGREVKRRIILGTYVLSAGYYDAYYRQAQQVRTLIREDYDKALAGVDVIAMPTSPTAAFKLGERTDDPVQMYLSDVFTVGANLAGLPAVTVPCGFTGSRLPIGLQLTGRAMDDATVLRIADDYERATPWSAEQPPRPGASPSRSVLTAD
jgi:aspartyl-tRNA(Asn)/glutamyl-tRNA(Gln) amidotransferase subunit A